MKRRIKIILANCTVNNGNRGCVALSYTTMYLIDKLLMENNVEYQFLLPDSRHQDCAIHKIICNERSIQYQDCDYPIGINKRDTVKLWTKKLLKNNYCCLENFKDCDYILDIGQGDSFADIYGERRFLSIDRIHKLARKYNKPYCLLPQTIGPFKNERIKKLAHKSIANATTCMARDKQSYNYVKENVPEQTTIKEYIDVAFFMPYNKKTFDNKYTHVGLNISALLWHGGYTRDNQFGLKDDYQTVIINIIDYFLSQPNIMLHLVPHVVVGERHIENDYAVCFDLQEKYNHPRLVLAPLFLDPIIAKDYISGLDFFIGARMHATIGAFSSGVPVIPMAYSRKFNGLFIDTLSYSHMVNLKTMVKEDILDEIVTSFKNREHLKKEIEIQMSTTVKDKEQLFYNELKTFFNIS